MTRAWRPIGSLVSVRDDYNDPSACKRVPVRVKQKGRSYHNPYHAPRFLLFVCNHSAQEGKSRFNNPSSISLSCTINPAHDQTRSPPDEREPRLLGCNQSSSRLLPKMMAVCLEAFRALGGKGKKKRCPGSSISLKN